LTTEAVLPFVSGLVGTLVGASITLYVARKQSADQLRLERQRIDATTRREARSAAAQAYASAHIAADAHTLALANSLGQASAATNRGNAREVLLDLRATTATAVAQLESASVLGGNSGSRSPLQNVASLLRQLESAFGDAVGAEGLIRTPTDGNPQTTANRVAVLEGTRERLIAVIRQLAGATTTERDTDPTAPIGALAQLREAIVADPE
jgi:hypothetical protein